MINVNFNSILELLKAFPDEQTCINHLEELRWNGNVISPFDPTSKVYDCKGNKYKCKNTGKYFNVRTATLFDNTKIELQKWFLAIWLVTSHKKGISSLQLGRDIDVTQKTAWFMLQRIRNCFGIENNNQLDNEIELDETYIGGKEGNKHQNKKALKEDLTTNEVRKTNAGRTLDKSVVFGMVERDGKINAKHISDAKAINIIPHIERYVKKGATTITDEWYAYNSLDSKGYVHKSIKHSFKIYVDGNIHTNTIEGFWSLLKRGIFGIYHFTSKKHLQKYIDEFVFRYNTRKATESNRFNLLLANNESRLTYKTLIANGN